MSVNDLAGLPLCIIWYLKPRDYLKIPAVEKAPLTGNAPESEAKSGISPESFFS